MHEDNFISDDDRAKFAKTTAVYEQFELDGEMDPMYELVEDTEWFRMNNYEKNMNSRKIVWIKDNFVHEHSNADVPLRRGQRARAVRWESSRSSVLATKWCDVIVISVSSHPLVVVEATDQSQWSVFEDDDKMFRLI